MSDNPVDLAARYNERLAAEHSNLRWRYANPNDRRSELKLFSLAKPVNKTRIDMELDLSRGTS